jgi:hypothetical protein
MKKILLLAVWFGVAGTAFAQNEILHYSNGSLSNEAVTSTINGDFLSLSIEGGFVPLSFQKGILSWGGPVIETVGELFWKGSLAPVTVNGSITSLAANPAWWIGPVIGAGQAGASQISTHGMIGGTGGINLGALPLNATGVVDTASGQFYFGLSLTTQLDLGGGSIVQVR